MGKSILYFLLTLLFTSIPVSVLAEEVDKFNLGGIFLKDKVLLNAHDDPLVKGITCFTSGVGIAFSFSDPSNVSIACRQTGKISGELTNQKNVFSKSKNFFFKVMKVDRFYDKRRNVLVYLSYVRKLTGTNASHSVSVVPLGFPLVAK